MTDEYSFAAELEAKERKKWRRIKIIVFSILGLLAFLLLIAYIFGAHFISTNDMYAEPYTVERDGIIYFVFPATDASGGTCRGGGIATGLCDYELGIVYSYRYIRHKQSRWDMWFNKGESECAFFSVTLDGDWADHKRYEDYNRDAYTTEYLMEHPGFLHERYLRVYYENPDGIFCLLWEHPEAEAIAEALGGELPEPTPDPRWEFMDGKR